jgi:hypothetical protein
METLDNGDPQIINAFVRVAIVNLYSQQYRARQQLTLKIACQMFN